MSAQKEDNVWLPCPWCGEQPEVSKHFKMDAWSLVHRCPVFTTLFIDWTDLELLQSKWNTRKHLT